MIDDIATLLVCGIDSTFMNVKVHATVESKKMQLSGDKCLKLHVSKKKE